MFNPNKPCVIFHIKEGKDLSSTCPFTIRFEFEPEKTIAFNEPFQLKDKLFTKKKDKISTNILITIGEIKMTFLINLYYAENHITIFKSKKIGVSYEIINQISYYGDSKPLEQISFKDADDDNIIVKDYDNIGNQYRRRFLIVNCPIEIDLPIKYENIKQNSSYKVVVLPTKKILVFQINSEKKNEKTNLDIDGFKLVQNRIDNLINKYSKDELNNISNELKKYNSYFDQALISKEDFDWKFEELQAFYYYHFFRMFYFSKTEKNDKLKEYYNNAIKIFCYNYKILLNTFEINIYNKILAIKSLYSIINYDSTNDKNKNYLIGSYTFMTYKSCKEQCYIYSMKYLNEIIEELKEDSFIFYPILQVNSGSNIDLNSEDSKNEIFEISMLNVEMIKNHLKSLMPKFIFIAKHPTIDDTRGAIIKNTGIIFIYESNIFHNTLGYSIEEYKSRLPKDAAINISFTLSHEIFMHQKFRSDMTSPDGKKTPLKFIDLRFNIKTFYFANNKNDLDCLAIFSKSGDKLKTIPDKGESGRMFEYFFEDPDRIENNIIHILKSYLGFGDLIDNVGLVINRKVDELINYINQKFKDKNVKPLLENEFLNKKREREELKDDIETDQKESDNERKKEKTGNETENKTSWNEEKEYFLNQVIS